MYIRFYEKSRIHRCLVRRWRGRGTETNEEIEELSLWAVWCVEGRKEGMQEKWAREGVSQAGGQAATSYVCMY